MSDEIRKVTVIGLGRMGAGIATNIQKAGFELTVYNRTLSKAASFAEKGANVANTAREAAAAADVVVTCLMDDNSVLANATGEDGLLAGLSPDKVHIGASTTSPGLATRLAGLHKGTGTHYVAAPVVGRPNMAAAGMLFTYVAGDPQVIARCGPVFDAYTQEVRVVAEQHALANYVKLAINYVVVAQIELMGQLFAFAEKSGIDAELATHVIDRFLGSQGVKNSYTGTILDRTFDKAGFELAGGFKDVQLMLQASADVRAPLNYASVIREKMVTAIAHGLERHDWSSIYEVTRMHAGLQ